jgi:hypothetical protein
VGPEVLDIFLKFFQGVAFLSPFLYQISLLTDELGILLG